MTDKRTQARLVTVAGGNHADANRLHSLDEDHKLQAREHDKNVRTKTTPSQTSSPTRPSHSLII